jgi:CBS domain-containing protein
MRVLRTAPGPPPRVRGLMGVGLVSAEPLERLTDVAARMRANRVGAVAVLDDGQLVGILSERDLLRALADGLNPRVTPVSASMTPDPRTIGPDDLASEAAELMIERGVRHLPVVKDGRVLGVISARDLLELERPAPFDLARCEPW